MVKKSAKKPRRGRPKPAKTPVRKSPGTALAVVKPVASIRIHDPQHLLPTVAPLILTDDVALDNIGMTDLALTEKEEAILSEPVKMEDILIKPQGVPYVSHPTYTRLLNRAFGRLGWAIRPASKPMKTGGLVCCYYQLYIHGRPVAVAMGEQEYHENNADQSYGDAYEATVASALRRLCKRLGIGLELWDKRFLHQFMQTHCVKVRVTLKKGGEEKDAYWWRRKDDPPFWQEGKQAKRDSIPSTGRSDSSSTEKINEKQVKRFWAIFRKTGRQEADLKGWLRLRYGLEHTTDILRKDYDAIVRACEAPVALPGLEPVDRDPGEEE